ncbi:MAG: 50S ribosome-binding GTPase [Armatimonadetes bacterium]|nr:50S ribosome-binding GTPase [Armatimonadota bacterium]
MNRLQHETPLDDPQLRVWAEPDEPADLTELDRLVDDAGKWVAHTGLLPDGATRTRLAGFVEQVRGQRAKLLTPLQVAIVGGTGVGKSSLLNALAGAGICPVSEKRPCTQEVTAYYHADNELGFDPALARQGRRVAHRREGLRDKILIDTPDYDSIDPEHRRMLAGVLRGADVILWVVTAEKYRDLRGARWLAEYRAGRAFAFVLNRADEGVEPAVLADLRGHLAELGVGEAPVYAVSALRRCQGGAMDDDFVSLELLLEHELDAHRIRAIKETNLAELAARLAQHLAEAVPEDARARVRAWRDGGEASWHALCDAVGERLAPKLLDDPRLKLHLEAWLGAGFGGPVGFCLAAAYAVRAVVSPASPKLWALREEPEVRLAAVPEELSLLQRRIETVRAGWRAVASERGLAGARRAAEGELPAADLAHRLDDNVRRRVGDAVRGARERRGLGWRLFGWLLNVPTWLALLGLPAWFVADRLGLFFGRPPVGNSEAWLQAGAIVLGLWLAGATSVLHGAVRWRARRLAARLRGVVRDAAEETLREPMLDRLEAEADALAADLSDLEGLLRRSGAGVGDGG